MVDGTASQSNLSHSAANGPGMPDVFGRALRDHYHDRRTEPLWRYDGPDRERHLERGFYLREVDPDPWVAESLDGPLVDVGCGTGDHALWYQDRHEVVATDVSAELVALCRERGVADAREMDVFDLSGAFARDRFASALVNGTQLGLGGSVRGVSELLAELASVTGPDATAVVDEYDPSAETAPDLLGHRPDPTPGLAHRVFHFEYGGEVGPELHFRLLSPDRLHEAAVGTGWRVADVRYGEEDCYYEARLAKR